MRFEVLQDAEQRMESGSAGTEANHALFRSHQLVGQALDRPEDAGARPQIQHPRPEHGYVVDDIHVVRIAIARFSHSSLVRMTPRRYPPSPPRCCVTTTVTGRSS